MITKFLSTGSLTVPNSLSLLQLMYIRQLKVCDRVKRTFPVFETFSIFFEMVNSGCCVLGHLCLNKLDLKKKVKVGL